MPTRMPAQQLVSSCCATCCDIVPQSRISVEIRCPAIYQVRSNDLYPLLAKPGKVVDFLFSEIEGLYLQNLLCFSLQANYGMTREKKIPEHQGSDLMWRGNEIMAQELFPPSHQLISTNLSSYFISVKQKHPHFKCN
ncbi:hypothetical protein HID58_082737 [Brassica napus]|uniref:Uncharacterized protein n=1 Tax=Brassica napus TaxID=3708 RepID=A0ABQ7YE92_BRANA|nr:hypothetical protein HID58_082737 [Brassica napus]